MYLLFNVAVFFFIMVAGNLYRLSICSILFYDFIEILCKILTIRIFCVCIYVSIQCPPKVLEQ